MVTLFGPDARPLPGETLPARDSGLVLPRGPVLPAGLNGNGSLPYQDVVLQRLAGIERWTGRLADVLAHPETKYAAFPGDGSMEPLPPGQILMDLRRRVVSGPSGFASISMVGIDEHVLLHSQSAVFVADSYVKAKLLSDIGMVFTLGPAFLEVPFQPSVDGILFECDTPFLLIALFSTDETPPNVRALSLPMVRTTTTTLTKAAAAGTADSLTALSFVPIFGSKTISQALWGRSTLITSSWVRKLVTVRNTSTANSIEVQVQGTGALPNAALYGWLADSQTSSRATIAAGASAVYESTMAWNFMRIGAAVAQGEDPGDTATVVCEFTAVSP